MIRHGNLLILSGAALSLGLLALLPGCGGGGNGNSGSNGGSGNSGGSSSTSYAEALTLAGGQTGALNLTASGSNATGTLAVAPAVVNARSRTTSPHGTGTITPGVYPVTGTLTNGSFTLSGTISGAAFSLTVTLPSGSTGGTFSLTTGTGPSATSYAGTLTTAPSGTGAESALAGTYQTVSLTNPVSGQMVTCPGTLAFASATASGNDDCVASEDTVLGADGTVTTTAAGASAAMGTYSVIGSTLIYHGTETGSSEQVTRYYTYALSGSTLTLTLFYSSAADEAAQAGDNEVFTYTRTSSTGSGGTGSGGTGSGGTGSLVLAGTTWRVSSVSSGSDSATCPGEARSDPNSPDSDVVVQCGSDDQTTFNADGTQTTLALGGDGQEHTITGTWSQSGDTVTRTDLAETPPDPTYPLPYTISGPITVIDNTDFKVTTSVQGALTSLTLSKE